MITKDSQVKSLKPKEKRYTNAAGDGLFLDVMPTGKKSWTVAYSKNGKRTRTKIGTYPVLSLKDARVLAQDLQRQALLGYSDILMKDLVKEWLSVYSPNWTSKKYEKNVIHRLELVTERIADVKANEVTRSMISDEIGLIVGRGTIETANRCLRLIKTLFDYAVAKEFV